MKKSIAILCILISGFALGQNYKLFKGSSKKAFTTYPLATQAYSIAFDSVKPAGPDSVYYNFCALSDVFGNSDSCVFWGPSMCFKQDVPVWLGSKVEFNNSHQYKFYSIFNDSLFFDFNMLPGDTTLFYSDAVQRFSIIYKKKDTLTVLSNSDSAKYYKVLHTDLSGNTISSALNQKQIIVAKNWGLYQFFQVDSFPSVLKPLRLIGNTTPEGGLYKITNGMLYDYQPGDEIQFYEHFADYGYPPSDYQRYRKYTILNRTDLTDSIIYVVSQELFNVGSVQPNITTINLTYRKSFEIARIPYELYSSAYQSLSMEDYCGIMLWTYIYSPDPTLMYCTEENCWGYADTQGPPIIESSTYVIGLGNYLESSYRSPAPPITYGFSQGTEIVYFKKNGIPCGSEVIVGMDENNDAKYGLSVGPNPASNSLQINADVPLAGMEVFDPGGRLVYTCSLEGTNKIVDLSELNDGIYFARFIFSDKKSIFKKIVLIRK